MVHFGRFAVVCFRVLFSLAYGRWGRLIAVWGRLHVLVFTTDRFRSPIVMCRACSVRSLAIASRFGSIVHFYTLRAFLVVWYC